MSTLFGIDIAQIVTTALTGQLRPATLSRKKSGVYHPVADNTTGAIEQEFHSEGIVEAYSQQFLKLGLTNSLASAATAGALTENSRRVLLLAQPLGTTPISGDLITIDDTSYRVTGIAQKDSAGATFIVEAEI